MAKNKEDDKIFLSLAEKYGIEVSEIRRIVYSFFDVIAADAKSLPFDNYTRIYSREKFNEFMSVYQIPFVGRLGTSYSRYLCWRRNEAENIEQENRFAFRKESASERAERIAKQLLEGKEVENTALQIKNILNHKKVWFVNKDGKRLARQVIPIKEGYVQDKES